MKTWPLIISIIVIFAVFCSPVLAISKSDLISQYKGQSSPTIPTPTITNTPTPTPTSFIPSWIVTPTPTPINYVQPVGSISVISDPAGASVYLDGSFKGFTPITITGISPTCGFESRPGRIRGYLCTIGEYFPHQIELTKIGYQEYTISDVIVNEGKTTSVSSTLTPISFTEPPFRERIPVAPTTAPTQVPTGTGTGTLLVSSYPSRANVYLDGAYKGVTPEPVPSTGSGIYIRGAIKEENARYDALTLTGLSADSHLLKITKEGYLDYSISVTVTGGETKSVTANLVQIPRLWNSPSGIPTTGWSIPSKEELLGPAGVYNTPDNSYAADLPSKGKPNIYLYSDRDLIAQVRLAPEYAITVSEPVYQPGTGWRAEIRNSSLNGNGDFLFYEALGSDFPWQKEEGYVIRAAYREQDMTFMLGQYGFNEKETVEFIDYWASHLIEDVDFVFYPQETEAVNQDMPLSVIPKPDHIMRIWFCAEPLVSAPEPVTQTEKIVREGFYIVEWGVIINDEYWINHSPASSEVLL